MVPVVRTRCALSVTACFAVNALPHCDDAPSYACQPNRLQVPQGKVRARSACHSLRGRVATTSHAKLTAATLHVLAPPPPPPLNPPPPPPPLAGKSSLINSVRGVHPSVDSSAAPVGVNECTKVVKVYPFGPSLPVRAATLQYFPCVTVHHMLADSARLGLVCPRGCATRSQTWSTCRELGRPCSRSKHTVRTRRVSRLHGAAQAHAAACACVRTCVRATHPVDKMRLDCFDAVVVATWCGCACVGASTCTLAPITLPRVSPWHRVTSTRFTEFDVKVIDELKKKGVPYFLVRDVPPPVTVVTLTLACPEVRRYGRRSTKTSTTTRSWALARRRPCAASALTLPAMCQGRSESSWCQRVGTAATSASAGSVRSARSANAGAAPHLHLMPLVSVLAPQVRHASVEASCGVRHRGQPGVSHWQAQLTPCGVATVHRRFHSCRSCAVCYHGRSRRLRMIGVADTESCATFCLAVATVRPSVRNTCHSGGSSTLTLPLRRATLILVRDSATAVTVHGHSSKTAASAS